MKPARPLQGSGEAWQTNICSGLCAEERPGEPPIMPQPCQQEAGHGQENGKSLPVCLHRCGPRLPQHRRQIRPPDTLRGRSAPENLTILCSPTYPPPRTLTPGRATRQQHSVLLPGLPRPNLHTLSRAPLPLNPCVDPICPCCFFPQTSLRSRPSLLAPSLAASVLPPALSDSPEDPGTERLRWARHGSPL